LLRLGERLRIDIFHHLELGHFEFKRSLTVAFLDYSRRLPNATQRLVIAVEPLIYRFISLRAGYLRCAFQQLPVLLIEKQINVITISTRYLQAHRIVILNLEFAQWRKGEPFVGE